MAVLGKGSRRLLAALVVLIIIGSCAAVYTLVVPKKGSLDLIGFDAERAYLDESALTGNGPRVPGTQADLDMAEYVQEGFDGAGLSNVQIEDHELTTFQVNAASLSLIVIQLRNPVRKTYVHITDFVLYQYSGSTNGDLRLEIVDVGNGTEEAFQGADVAGKAVLSTLQCLPRAAEHGAMAVLVQNTRLAAEMGFPPYSGGLYGSDSLGDSIPYPDAYPNAVVPTCAVSKEVGDEIREAINNSRHMPVIGTGTVWIEMNFDTTIGEGIVHNVIGDVKGSASKDIIYIVAHRDCTYINPGAVDNAAGVATIMEMARQLSKYDVGLTIRFIATDAEETGLLGATEYVKSHEAEVRDHGLLCINFDMNDVNLERVKVLNIEGSDANHTKMLKELCELMFSAHPDLQKKYAVNITKGGGGADGGPFMKRGTAGCLAMGEWGSSWEYHTQWDTIEHVNQESWAVSGMLLGSLALHLAS
jgi:aminopeptidase YwaD